MPHPTPVIDIFVPPGPQAAAQAEQMRGLAARHPFEVHIGARDAASSGRDALFIAAGVMLAEGALDALAECAQREPGTATVTAFSNRARYAAYPEAGHGELPPNETPASLAARFAQCNRGETVDLPFAEPAVAYVTRAAIERAGPIEPADADLMAFCRRAKSAGLRHVLCGEVFVADARPPLAAVEGADAAELHAVVQADPARPLRRRVDVARLIASGKPRLLLVTHRWGGGVDRHVHDVARLAGDVAEVLLLRPDGPGTVELSWLAPGESLRAWFSAADWESLLELVRAIGISRLHYHHVHQLPRKVLDLPADLGAPYDVTLHDYFPICPRYHLMPDAESSCEAEPGRCERCLEARPAQWDLSLPAWRELFHGFLRAAARVIAPSHDCAARIQRYFPDVVVREWPHPEAPFAVPALHKVVLLGGISAIKGSRVLEACVADARARQLPLHFHVIGHVERPMPTLPAAPLTIGGSYPEAALGERIALERPDAFLFLPRVAETYSYTLSAALATGLPILALAVGAFPERLRGYASHALLDRNAAAAEINDALLALLRRAPTPTAAVAGVR